MRSCVVIWAVSRWIFWHVSGVIICATFSFIMPTPYFKQALFSFRFVWVVCELLSLLQRLVILPELHWPTYEPVTNKNQVTPTYFAGFYVIIDLSRCQRCSNFVLYNDICRMSSLLAELPSLWVCSCWHGNVDLRLLIGNTRQPATPRVWTPQLQL